MNVPEDASRRTRVRLPADVVRPFRVFVNGVQQEEGTDFRVEGRTPLLPRAEERGQARLLALTMWVGIADVSRRTTPSTSPTSAVGSRSSRRSSPSSRSESRLAAASVGRWSRATTGSRSRGSSASTRRARERSTGSTSRLLRVRSTASRAERGRQVHYRPCSHDAVASDRGNRTRRRLRRRKDGPSALAHRRRAAGGRARPAPHRPRSPPAPGHVAGAQGSALRSSGGAAPPGRARRRRRPELSATPEA